MAAVTRLKPASLSEMKHENVKRWNDTPCAFSHDVPLSYPLSGSECCFFTHMHGAFMYPFKSSLIFNLNPMLLGYTDLTIKQ